MLNSECFISSFILKGYVIENLHCGRIAQNPEKEKAKSISLSNWYPDMEYYKTVNNKLWFMGDTIRTMVLNTLAKIIHPVVECMHYYLQSYIEKHLVLLNHKKILTAIKQQALRF